MTAPETPSGPDVASLRRPARVRLAWLLAVLAVLAVIMLASVAFGSRVVGWSDIVAAFGGTDETLDQAAVVKRLPRTILAALVGAALALSGTVMQGVTRNPLADPGILGVNAGATFAMVVGMTSFGFTAMGHFLPLAFVVVDVGLATGSHEAEAAAADHRVVTGGAPGEGHGRRCQRGSDPARHLCSHAPVTLGSVLPAGSL